MRRKMLGLVFCGAVALAAAPPMYSQNGGPLSFEVASVRLSAPTSRFSQRITDTRIDLTGQELRSLLWMAFGIDPLCCRDHMSAPGWLNTVRVDIQATLPPGATHKQVPEMLRSLLTQRFGLRTHVEPRPADGYELVVGSGGLKMQEVEEANEIDKEFPPDPSGKAALRDSTEFMPMGPMRAIALPLAKTRMITDRSTIDQTFTGRGTMQIDTARIAMRDFAWLLGMATGRPVIDGTKLAGVYKFTIELPVEAFASVTATVAAQTGRTIDPSGVSAVKAVEQLGLKLEPRRLPMDTIVVDAIERAPSDN
jgi:uncharacterized protein (TIGR03435 family)